ncbi:MAG: ABC transporter ATP-binding protein, partial [Rhodoferax sp.]|nr:ABC transporter ATP-binding protein [Rhodoferax sp.]
MSNEVMLKVAQLQAWYDESHVLHGVDFEVRSGEIVTLLGRNGAGKSTTLKSIMGLIPRRAGSISFQGREMMQARPDQIGMAGIAFCPEDRGIFRSLTVTENLMLPPVIASGGLDLDTIYAMFPNLKERASSRGTMLSGGEQQMLANARCLIGEPRLVMFDEPSLGLAPTIVHDVLKTIRDLNA